MIIRANELFQNKQALFHNVHEETSVDQAAKQEDRKTVFAGQSSITDAYQIKREAVREAVKMKLTAHAGETDIDNTVEQLHNKNTELDAGVKSAQEEIRKLDEIKAEVEAAGGTFDEYDTLKAEWQKQVDSGMAQMEGNRGAVIGISIERVKSQAMLNADRAADKIMAAASKEIAGTLFGEAVEEVQEKFEENIEEAQEKAEQEAEEKEKLEEARAEREAAEAQAGSGTSSTTGKKTGEQVSEAVTDTLSAELRNLVKTQKLLDEDTLGLVVDEKK